MDDDLELRAQWTALVEADALHRLPVEALVASIKDLASELLVRTSQPRTCPHCQRDVYLVKPGTYVHICGSDLQVDPNGNVTLLRAGSS